MNTSLDRSIWILICLFALGGAGTHRLFGYVQDHQEARLQIINGTQQRIEVFWVKSEDQRVSNGMIEAGEQTTIKTTLGHKFLVLGQSEEILGAIESLVRVQAFRVGGVPEYYVQRIEVDGFPIVASERVSAFALKEAGYIIRGMLKNRPDVLDAMIKSGSRLCILGWNEFTTDQPEWRWLASRSNRDFPGVQAKDYFDARARGMGGSQSDPYCSCGEENLLGYPGDPYWQENILIHELAHNIHLRGMVNIDATFDSRVLAAYEQAKGIGLWKGKYASVNHHEYFAEGVQSWFDNNRQDDHDHNHVDTRLELMEYDPGLASLCREVFRDTEFRYTKPVERLEGHLEGYRLEQAPTFTWPKRLKEAQLEIRRQVQSR
ncbi:MAG: hypothetical protein ACK449_09400 [Planctomycetota bacterium]|jgi:hypothetical protein